MLNKHGWGLKQMLIMTAILFLFLLIMVHYIIVLYANIRENNNAVYVSLENKIAYAARDYINDDHPKSSVIKLSTLKRLEYIDTFKDADDNNCRGYVLYENGEYLPFISCNNYKTPDYNENNE